MEELRKIKKAMEQQKVSAELQMVEVMTEAQVTLQTQQAQDQEAYRQQLLHREIQAKAETQATVAEAEARVVAINQQAMHFADLQLQSKDADLKELNERLHQLQTEAQGQQTNLIVEAQREIEKQKVDIENELLQRNVEEHEV
jgi:hypothetical protein